jgi:hypothetical protein
LYNWKATFARMDVSDARRLKALEDENGDPLVRGYANGYALSPKVSTAEQDVTFGAGVSR